MGYFERVMRVVETGSTNDDMAAMLGEERARGLVLVADYQTAGSGRRGRSWVAPAGSSLLCTAALPDPVRSEQLRIVPYWAALCVHAALDALGVRTVLQWPNDVLTQRGKIAGILCISRVTGSTAWGACGIGINVLRPHDEAAFAQVEGPPAFVSDFARASVDDVLHELIAALDAQYPLLEDEHAIVSKWEDAAQLPRPYSILKDNEAQPFSATALRLSPDGSLIVQHGNREESVSLADARVLR